MNDIGLALFAYCRPELLRRVIESIRNNNFKKLYIFQDGLKNENDRILWEKVNHIICEIDFIETELHISETNKGLANSLISGIEYVLERHETVIALEDDVVLGNGYSEYMEQCFEKYRYNSDVTCIAGGGWPVDIPESYQYDVFFSYRSSSIAWGTWRDRWQNYKRDYTLFASINRDKDKKAILERSGKDIGHIMEAQVLGKCDSWALFWTLMQINQKGVCVIPTRYLAQDIGHDGTHGTNSTIKTTRYDTVLYNKPDRKMKLPDNIIIVDSIIDQIDMILSLPSKAERLETYNNILYKWIFCLYNNKKISTYFKKNNINSVYIYGLTDIAKLLVQQLPLENIKVNGILVLCKDKDEFCGYPVYDFSDNIDIANEPIIVTPVYDMKYIKYSMNKRFNAQRLINVEELIDNIIN
jgi:hypothetical protein